MKRLINILVALSATFALSVSCYEMTDEEKENAGNAFSKVLIAGEYGVVSLDGESEDGNDLPLFGDGVSYTDEKGRPTIIWVLNLDGTYFIAPNRVWKNVYGKGTWEVSKDEIHFKADLSAIETSVDKVKIKSFKDGLLTLQDEKITVVLKRLADADKCPQLKSVEFVANLSNDGKLYIDPSLELNSAGYYKLDWKYDPQDYEPYNTLKWTSSNPEVATVNDEGYVRPGEGVNSGETTITLECDYVKSEITLKFFEVN